MSITFGSSWPKPSAIHYPSWWREGYVSDLHHHILDSNDGPGSHLSI
jgi:hypothetical protein